MKKRLSILAVVAVLLVVVVWAFPHLLPRALAACRSDIRFLAQSDEKTLFITIDDAPSQNTALILAVLKKHQVHATFFIIADRAKQPTQLYAITADGHSLGNHLRTTKPCSRLSMAEFKADFDTCADLLSQFQPASLFRPSSDFGTPEQIAYANGKGYRAVMGTVFPVDHWITNSDSLDRLVRWLAVNGGIIIMHDGDLRGKTTAETLDHLIPKLKKSGYTFGDLDHAMK